MITSTARDRFSPDKRPTVYYKHTLMPHVPWIFLPNGQRYNRNVLGPIPGLNSSELSVFDPTLVRQSWQRHLLQVGTADMLVGELIEKLKETGVYDRATMVVMADHGVSFRRGALSWVTWARTFASAPCSAPIIRRSPTT